jgi:hypothetical protein
MMHVRLDDLELCLLPRLHPTRRRILSTVRHLNNIDDLIKNSSWASTRISELCTIIKWFSLCSDQSGLHATVMQILE